MFFSKKMIIKRIKVCTNLTEISNIKNKMEECGTD